MSVGDDQSSLKTVIGQGQGYALWLARTVTRSV